MKRTPKQSRQPLSAPLENVDDDYLVLDPEGVTGVRTSDVTLRKWIREGRFPAPVKYGSVNVWRVGDLRQYVRGLRKASYS